MPMAANSGGMVVRNETALHFFMAIWTGVCLIHLGFPVASVVSSNWSVCYAPSERVHHNGSCKDDPLGTSRAQA